MMDLVAIHVLNRFRLYLSPNLPTPKKSRRGGRPWADNRNVFEGIPWILRAGVSWTNKAFALPSAGFTAKPGRSYKCGKAAVNDGGPVTMAMSLKKRTFTSNQWDTSRRYVGKSGI